MTLPISASLAASCAGDPARAAWLRRLPDAVQELLERWSLTLERVLLGEDVTASWVAHVSRAGTPAVLKVGMPHMEAEDEIEGLRFWGGDPTVQLLEADKDFGAMLLEPAGPESLRVLGEEEQDVVITGLLKRLWRVPPATSGFRLLSAMVTYWADETKAASQYWPKGGLVEEGLRIFEELTSTSVEAFLLATDLHAGNVLRSERELWLVIDPKPFLGDPPYDLTQHLFNCMDRMRADPTGTIHRLADLAGVDAERVRLWTFARAATESRRNWHDEKMELAKAIAP